MPGPQPLLHAAARELLDELEGRYSVWREEFADDGGPGVLLRPVDGVADAFGVTYTAAPGLWTWVGGERGSHLPASGTTPRDAAAHLESLAGAVVTTWTRRPGGTLTFHTADEFLGLTVLEARAWAGALGWTIHEPGPFLREDDRRDNRITVIYDELGVVTWAEIG